MHASAPGALPAAPADRLPDGFAVRLDPRVRRRDGGSTLLGGSPLRLLRLAPRARELLTGERLVVRDATTASLAARLLDAGLAHPDLAPATETADVTVVVPVKDRPVELARLLDALRADPGTAGLPVVVVDDGSASPVQADGAVVVRHATSRGPAAARNAGLREVADAVRRLPRLRLRAPPRLAAGPRGRTWPTRGSRSWPPASSGCPAGAGCTSRSRSRAPWTWGRAPRRSGRCRPSPTCPAPRCCAAGSALGAVGFDEALRVAEDVDLVWRLSAAGWRVRLEPAAEVAHANPTRVGEWVRRRAFYGTGAALLAERHGPLVSPLVIAPELAAAAALAVAGGRAGRVAAAGVVAVRAVRLSRRLARPGERPPVVLAAVLTARSSGAAARALSRAATRHHWPRERWPWPWSRGGPGAGCWSSPSPRGCWPGCRTGTGPDRSVTWPRGGWTTSPTARGCGPAPSGRVRRGRCCPPGRRPRDTCVNSRRF